MDGKENTRPSAATLERAKVETAAGQAAISNSDFNTKDGKTQGVISGVLLRGKQNAQTAAKIAGVLGLSDTRHVTTLIEAERAHGGAICASTGQQPGYFLPETPDELAGYVKSLRRRIKAITATEAALTATLDKWTGQMRLDLPDREGT